MRLNAELFVIGDPVDQSQMRTGGVKKAQNFADVIYGWPPIRRSKERGSFRTIKDKDSLTLELNRI